MIEGNGLHELARHLQLGSVLMVQEYAQNLWPTCQQGALVQSIAKLGI